MATKGYASPEVEKVYARARELSRQVGDSLQLFRALAGLWGFHLLRAELQTAHELGEHLLRLARSIGSPALRLEADFTLGVTLFWLGKAVPARAYLEHGIALYDPLQRSSRAFRTVHDSWVISLAYAAWVLWLLGYPEQALKKMQEATAVVQELSHPFSLVVVLDYAAGLHQFRREARASQEQAEAAITLATEQQFSFWGALATITHGWALSEQGQREEGMVQIRQGLAAWQATGTELNRTSHLAVLAEAQGKLGQHEEGLARIAEALAHVDGTEERIFEAELYRLKGQLTLQQVQVSGSKLPVETIEARSWRLATGSPSSQAASLQSQVPNGAEREAEGCFQKAIEIARRQRTKSLELRAVMSLSRLWQYQGKKTQAQQMLAEIYGWFTEGFDTKDLQEAKALLDELS